jgi:hypothetical protein
VPVNIFVFFLFAVPAWVLLLVVASSVSDWADRRRVAREHPGERWTPCGWRPVEDA